MGYVVIIKCDDPIYAEVLKGQLNLAQVFVSLEDARREAAELCLETGRANYARVVAV